MSQVLVPRASPVCSVSKAGVCLLCSLGCFRLFCCQADVSMFCFQGWVSVCPCFRAASQRCVSVPLKRVVPVCFFSWHWCLPVLLPGLVAVCFVSKAGVCEHAGGPGNERGPLGLSCFQGWWSVMPVPACVVSVVHPEPLSALSSHPCLPFLIESNAVNYPAGVTVHCLLARRRPPDQAPLSWQCGRSKAQCGAGTAGGGSKEARHVLPKAAADGAAKEGLAGMSLGFGVEALESVTSL